MSAEMVELNVDVEKYSKSPERRVSDEHLELNNDSSKVESVSKMPKEKNINIEISQAKAID